MVPPSSSADAGPIGAFMDQHRPRFVAANSAGCDDDPGLADRSLRAAWTAMPEAEREEYVRTLRWNEWAYVRRKGFRTYPSGSTFSPNSQGFGQAPTSLPSSR